MEREIGLSLRDFTSLYNISRYVLQTVYFKRVMYKSFTNIIDFY